MKPNFLIRTFLFLFMVLKKSAFQELKASDNFQYLEEDINSSSTSLQTISINNKSYYNKEEVDKLLSIIYIKDNKASKNISLDQKKEFLKESLYYLKVDKTESEKLWYGFLSLCKETN